MNYFVDILITIFETLLIITLAASYFQFVQNKKTALILSGTVFTATLCILSFFPALSIIRLIFTLVGGTFLIFLSFQATLLFSLVISGIFCIICAATDLISSIGLSYIGIATEIIMQPGQPRFVFIILAHFIDLLLITLIISLNRKSNYLLSWKWLIPIIPVQVLSNLACIFMLNTALREQLPFYDTVLLLVLLYINVALIFYVKRIQKTEYNHYQAKLKEEQFRIQQDYYSRLHESQEETRALWHDIEKYLLAAKSFSGNSEDVDKIVNHLELAMASVTEYIDVGNDDVSSILNHYYSEMKEDNIDLKIDIQISPELAISITDLYIILGNTIENSIDACQLIKEENRQINIKMRQQGSILFYSINNPYIEGTSVHKNKRYHGYGTENVCRTVNKNNGNYTAFYKDGIYNVDIRLEC